jgi:hypothetical protein
VGEGERGRRLRTLLLCFSSLGEADGAARRRARKVDRVAGPVLVDGARVIESDTGSGAVTAHTLPYLNRLSSSQPRAGTQVGPPAPKVEPKKVPNPSGKKGGKPHQNKINQIEKDITDRGNIAEREYEVDTQGGMKGKRFVDVAELDQNGKIIELHQVGVRNAHGFPVKREMDAIVDIMNAIKKVARFHGYNKDH